MILNLDGNGIRTFGLAAGIHFDQDANGFQESTGWVTPGNGVLMLDIDGNKRLRTGNELFGDFTVLPNGMRAANGFQALAQYDLNRDGKIDSSDPIWGQLKIWQYSELDLEAYDPDESGRINTLAELGITAIYLDSTITNSTNDAGNLEIRSGHFEWADGRTGTIGEYRLQRNTADTIPTDFREVPSEIEALPDLQGLGNVYNLHQAMLRDPSGQLRSLVEAFISATNPATRSSILEQIISKWTGADSVAPNSRGGFMDGRRIVALEHLYGESRANPDATLAIAWNETYRQVFEIF
ncbi:MAG: calcium-binding protein, partial [Thermodesulfobacteriota bacterium]